MEGILVSDNWMTRRRMEIVLSNTGIVAMLIVTKTIKFRPTGLRLWVHFPFNVKGLYLISILILHRVNKDHRTPRTSNAGVKG